MILSFRLPLLAAALSLPAAALAQAPSVIPDTPPAVFQQVIDCRTVGGPAARLACYDRTVDAMAVASEKKELFVADKAEVQETRKGLFGFSLPKIKIFGNDDETGGVDEIDTTVRQYATDRRGRLILLLEDGARWQQIDNESVIPPKAGDPIHIGKASLGSYLAKIKSGRAFRIQRLNN